MPIRPLPQSLINKIAAGEVIERPASVVKELLENALDAQATRVDVSIASGGLELIRVTDNGCGIPADEMPLAVASHATSKIASAEDLFCVRTLGFRGEALASMGEVSRLLVRSRPAGSASGSEIRVTGGVVSEVVPCGCPVGTTVEVRDLFFNTPVRRKFLRSAQTELGHVSEAFVRVALAVPQIHLTLEHNGRPVFDLPGASSWLDRIAAVFGRELADCLIAVESTDGSVRLHGYVAPPSHSRSNSRMQYLFLNGRFIRDRSLLHALAEAYRGLLVSGRYPIALVSLEMPPDLVDVNVHPTKLEVRFQDSGRLYSQLLATLRSKFLATDLTARPHTPLAGPALSAHDEAAETRLRQQLVDWAKGQVASWGRSAVAEAGGPRSATTESAAPASATTSFSFSATASAAHEPVHVADAHPKPVFASGSPLELTLLDRTWQPVGPPDDDELPSAPDALGSSRAEVACGSSSLRGIQSGEVTGPRDGAVRGGVVASVEDTSPSGSTSTKAVQFHDRYLIVETDEGLMVIDQHALHERILYENLRARVASGTIECQNLLVPEPVDLSPAEAAVAIEHRQVLAQLGMKVEPFGGNTVLVTSYPAMLANFSVADVLRGLVDRLVAGDKVPDRRDLLDDLMHTIACKAAIKAGERLSQEEVAALVGQIHLIDDAHHCPHGRPAAVLFTRDELDRHFQRTSAGRQGPSRQGLAPQPLSRQGPAQQGLSRQGLSQPGPSQPHTTDS